jgi:Flp pilus assembly protein TadD
MNAPHQPSQAHVLTDIAQLMKQGAEHRRWQQLDEAENLYRQAAELAKTQLGEQHEARGHALHELGILLEEKGDVIEARNALMDALGILELHLGNQHSETIAIFGRLHHLFR